jgi:para-aminobenzoate synthetase/4-amino-4-deoxychorismate lyase
LLAGTYRAQLLDEGAIQERVITVDEFKQCKEIFLINSVRRWMNVQLI